MIQPTRKSWRISGLDVYQGDLGRGLKGGTGTQDGTIGDEGSGDEGSGDEGASGGRGGTVRTVMTSSGPKFAIGNLRTQAAQEWRQLPDDQREPYETRARTRNQEREARAAAQLMSGDREESAGDDPL